MKTRYGQFIFPVSLGVLIVFYGVGLWGLTGKDTDNFASLTPLNLLLTSALLIANLSDYKLRYFLFPAIAWLTGFVVEAVGVHTQLIFGSYHYGDNLGPKVFEVPLMIGVNWALLVYTACGMVRKVRAGIPGKAFIAALMMTGLDVLIEPVAMKVGFWDWTDGVVPFKNYVAWFVVSYFLCWVFFRMHNEHTNKLAPWVFVVQVIFFTVLNFAL